MRPSRSVMGVVLAAGLGDRMRPLTDARPKALLPVLDLPLVTWSLAWLASGGVRQGFVNAHHHAQQLGTYLKESKQPVRVQVSMEEQHLLGTAGGLARIAAKLKGRVVVTNADVLTDAPLQQLLATHALAKAPATLLCVPPQGHADFHVVGGKVSHIVDRGQPSGSGPGMVTYAGIGVFEAELLQDLDPEPSGIVEKIFMPLVKNKTPPAVLMHRGFWIDAGTIPRYLDANFHALRGYPGGGGAVARAHAWLASGEEGPLVGPCYLAEGSRVHPGSRIGPQTIVGAGATISSGARLERCVVWPNAQVEPGEYHDTVFMPDAAVITDGFRRTATGD